MQGKRNEIKKSQIPCCVAQYNQNGENACSEGMAYISNPKAVVIFLIMKTSAHVSRAEIAQVTKLSPRQSSVPNIPTDCSVAESGRGHPGQATLARPPWPGHPWTSPPAQHDPPPTPFQFPSEGVHTNPTLYHVTTLPLVVPGFFFSGFL